MSTKSKSKATTPRKTRLKENLSDDPDSAYASESSPPKVKRANQTALSPSSMITNLTIISNKISPKQLFPETKVCKFAAAKGALQNSTSASIVHGRESQVTTLTECYTSHVNNRHSGLMYLCGQPGTGKTATALSVLNALKLKEQIPFEQIYINCTCVRDSNDIYNKIYANLSGDKPTNAKNGLALVERVLKTTDKYYVLILDEIDQLECKKQSVLYKLFEWPSIFEKNILLIGIANALDLPDRLLPRLKTSRRQLQVLHFTPYDKQQIAMILTKRLQDAHAVDVFAPGAIQVLASKVSAISGDLRRALDIARRAVELVEQERRKSTLIALDENVASTLEKVGLKHILTVINQVFTSDSHVDEQLAESFPLQQKILLTAAVAIAKNSNARELTVGRLFDVYKRICVKWNIQSVSQSEVLNLVELIATRGILQLVKSKKNDVRTCRVALVWDSQRLENAVQDATLTAAVLTDPGILK